MANTETPTQHFVPISEIRDDVVVLKNGQLCGVLLTTSINLSLKSSDEQQSVLRQFQSFLNTIDFPIQIYVQSRKLDIRPYLAYLKTLEPNQHNTLMQTQLHEYAEFIRTFTEEVDIMKKAFFVVIPYETMSIPGKGTFIRSSHEQDDSEFEKHRAQLGQRVGTVIQGLRGVGVEAVRLGKDELIELYYHIFNPGELSNAPKE